MDRVIKREKSNNRITCCECHKEIINEDVEMFTHPDNCPYCGAKLSFWDWIPEDSINNMIIVFEAAQKKAEGVSLIKSGNFDEAVKVYDDCISQNAEDVDLWNYKGIALLRLNRHKEAIKCFDKSIEINSNQAEPWRDKGEALVSLNQLDKAITCIDRALAIDTSNGVTWLCKGIALRELGRPIEANKSFMMADSLGVPREYLEDLKLDVNADKIKKNKPKWKFWGVCIVFYMLFFFYPLK